MPNIVGHMSFSLIGLPRQPAACDFVNFIEKRPGDRFWRVIVCRQRRNLSDNLFFRRLDFLAPGLTHSFEFTLVAKSAYKEADNVDLISGWIFMHEARLCPRVALLPVPNEEDLKGPGLLDRLKAFRKSTLEGADFAVCFQMTRKGVATFHVPASFRSQHVKIEGQDLSAPEGLRALGAQCFYFLRDISHTHYHHHSRSDNLTSIWRDNNKGRWIRETLYELHKRALMSRSVKQPLAQESALGILAYANAFERHIANPFRRDVNNSAYYIPEYHTGDLKESLMASLETKRRIRVQRNVAAAAIPALTVASLLLAASLYRDGAGPFQSLLALFQGNQYYLLGLYIALLYWVVSLAELIPPLQHLPPLKQITQLLATKGRRAAAAVMALIATSITVAIVSILTS